jgi:hypothetical protein
MPIFSIRNNDTQEEWEEWCPWADLQKLLKKNPNWEQIITKAPIQGDPMRNISGLKHTPEFRDALQRVKANHPLGTFDVGNKTAI